MRTLRLSRVGTVVLALVGGPSGAVLAQDSEVDLSAPHSVTGSLAWGGVYESGETSEDGLSVHSQGWTVRVWSGDDPRLSGSARIVLNKDVFPDAKQFSGTIRIENDGGAWAGTPCGYREPKTKPNRQLNIELTREGGYAGHGAVLQTVGFGDDHFDGFVFPAPLLDYPAPIQPFTR